MILSILDINYFRKQMLIYLLISMFCYIFGRVYEMFSHNVYSSYMMDAYIIPLILGFLVSLMISIFKLKINRLSVNIYNAGVSTITVYSILRGVLEIYGTTNTLINIYLFIGVPLLIIGSIISIIESKREGKGYV